MSRRASSHALALLRFWLLVVTAGIAFGQNNQKASLTAVQRKSLTDSFEMIWSTLRDQYWDPSMSGLNWQSTHDRCLRKLNAARNADEAREVMDQMIHQLPSSHLAIIPAKMYGSKGGKRHTGPDEGKPDLDDASDPNGGINEGVTGLTVTVIDQSVAVETVEQGSAAMQAGITPGQIIVSVNGALVQEVFDFFKAAPSDVKASLIEEVVQSWLNGPPGSSVRIVCKSPGTPDTPYDVALHEPSGKLVQFGNLPPEHVVVEHRKLTNGIGYIRLNIFLDPVTVMPEIENAIADFKNAPGIVLDLRNNPGGLGIMAMGIAGWFVGQDGLRLGTMISRGSLENFDINPRMEAYTGRLAVLVNHGSASTSEIIAQGLQDLGRARIFGSRTAGAALPSEIIQLPDGDRFQYPEANYKSLKGRILEGNGVQPDVVVAPTLSALLAGRDLPLEAASAWSNDPVSQNKSASQSK